MTKCTQARRLFYYYVQLGLGAVDSMCLLDYCLPGRRLQKEEKETKKKKERKQPPQSGVFCAQIAVRSPHIEAK